MSMHCKKVILKCCREVRSLTGDAAEIGVYRGESARLICEQLPQTLVHLYDTFCGMPDRLTKFDGVTAGMFSDTSTEIVNNTLTGLDNYLCHVGLFPETADNMPLKFVHIDCDLHFSTKAAVHWAWQNLVPGGMILDDDYGASSCHGAKRAIDEFIQHTPGAVIRFLNRVVVISKGGI